MCGRSWCKWQYSSLDLFPKPLIFWWKIFRDLFRGTWLESLTNVCSTFIVLLLIRVSSCMSLIYNFAHRHLFENGPNLHCYSMLCDYCLMLHYLEVYYPCCDLLYKGCSESNAPHFFLRHYLFRVYEIHAQYNWMFPLHMLFFHIISIYVYGLMPVRNKGMHAFPVPARFLFM